MDSVEDPDFCGFVDAKLFEGFGSGAAGCGALEITFLAVPVIIFGVINVTTC